MVDPGSKLEMELRRAMTDLSWLDRCHCDQKDLEEFFVKAGRTMSDEALEVSRTCPARRQEILFAYGRGIFSGYAGGLSPAQRAAMTLQEALDFAEVETRDAFTVIAARKAEEERVPIPAGEAAAEPESWHHKRSESGQLEGQYELPLEWGEAVLHQVA